MKFIHCADLHIDSPFKQLSGTDLELQSLLIRSTYDAFQNVISIAIQNQVDCVVVSGDIFERANRSIRALIKFKDGISRLAEFGIPCFIVHGNHDPAESWEIMEDWPDNVHFFPSNDVMYLPVYKEDTVIAQIYGISYSKAEETRNLALKFQRTTANVPHIAILHTNLGGISEHSNYAPCTMNDLQASGMDYWALGHIHKGSIVRAAQPAVVYSGCTQSTNINETGAKGCYLVSCDPGAEPDIQFIPTDLIRFSRVDVDVSDVSDIDGIRTSVISKCQEVAESMESRHSIVRALLTGRTRLNSFLRTGTNRRELEDAVNEQFDGSNPKVYLEKITLSTASSYSMEELRLSNNFVADILSVFDELEDGDSDSQRELLSTIDKLFTNWAGIKHLEKIDSNELSSLIAQARIETIGELVDRQDATA